MRINNIIFCQQEPQGDIVVQIFEQDKACGIRDHLSTLFRYRYVHGGGEVIRRKAEPNRIERGGGWTRTT